MRAWSSLHLIVVASYFSLRDSCSCAPRLVIHYTGRPSSDWRAETLRELPIARLECDQRRCRRAIVRVEVFDLNCLRLGRQLTDGLVVGISRFDSFRIRAHPFVGSPQMACRSAAPVRGRKDTGSRADSRANPRVACRCLGTVSIIRQHRVHSHRSFSTQRNATDDAWIVRERRLRGPTRLRVTRLRPRLRQSPRRWRLPRWRLRRPRPLESDGSHDPLRLSLGTGRAKFKGS